MSGTTLTLAECFLFCCDHQNKVLYLTASYEQAQACHFVPVIYKLKQLLQSWFFDLIFHSILQSCLLKINNSTIFYTRKMHMKLIMSLVGSLIERHKFPSCNSFSVTTTCLSQYCFVLIVMDLLRNVPQTQTVTLWAQHIYTTFLMTVYLLYSAISL